MVSFTGRVGMLRPELSVRDCPELSVWQVGKFSEWRAHERGRPFGRPQELCRLRWGRYWGRSNGVSRLTVSTKSKSSACIVKSIGLKFTSQKKQRPRFVRGLTTATSSRQLGHWNASCPSRILWGHCQCSRRRFQVMSLRSRRSWSSRYRVIGGFLILCESRQGLAEAVRRQREQHYNQSPGSSIGWRLG